MSKSSFTASKFPEKTRRSFRNPHPAPTAWYQTLTPGVVPARFPTGVVLFPVPALLPRYATFCMNSAIIEHDPEAVDVFPQLLVI